LRQKASSFRLRAPTMRQKASNFRLKASTLRQKASNSRLGASTLRYSTAKEPYFQKGRFLYQIIDKENKVLFK